jgi:WD40 repeat protein
LRLDGADIKDILKQFAYVDWRERSPDEYLKLLQTCRQAIPPKSASAPKEKSGRSRVLKGHEKGVMNVEMTKDGRKIVSGSDDKSIRDWDAGTGNCLSILEGHTDAVWSVAITEDGNKVVSGGSDRTIRIWDPETGNRKMPIGSRRAYGYGICSRHNSG